MNQNKLSAAILIVSETAHKDPSTDKSGPTLRDVFEEDGSWNVKATKIVPDTVLDIQEHIEAFVDEDDAVNLIITSGGTGFATKDVTPEAVTPLIDRYAPGLVHGMLAASLQVTPFAMMSRPVAGVRNKTLIITLPGSPKGAKENLESIIKLLPHACRQAAGEDSRMMHSGGMQKLEKDAGVGNGQGKPNATSPNRDAKGHDHHHHHHHHGHGHGHAGPVAHTDSSTRPVSNDPRSGPSARHRQSPYLLVSVEDALASIREHVPDPVTVTRPVNIDLINHALAADVQAAESVPAFRASIVDGYAIRTSPSTKKNAKGPFPVAFVAHAQAGKEKPAELHDGEIARVTTGAPVPEGADAVVMVEDTSLVKTNSDGQEELEVDILTDGVKAGENIREAGSDVKQGDLVMRKGEGISATGGEFGLLASVGVKAVSMYRPPVVGVLSTGDEIVPHDRTERLRMGEVRDTNRPTLLAAVRSYGFEAIDLGIVQDKADALETRLRSTLLATDVLITSGGVSMGELDLLKPTLERSLGGTIHFGRVAMKPGKPTTFATVPSENLKDPVTGLRGGKDGLDHKVVFSLPGNPASAVVTFLLFVLPALHAMSGVEPAGLPRIRVRMDDEVRCDGTREEYHRVVVGARGDDTGLWASSTGGQRSSRIGSFRGANALVRLPAGGGIVKRGESVEALLMGDVVGL